MKILEFRKGGGKDRNVGTFQSFPPPLRNRQVSGEARELELKRDRDARDLFVSSSFRSATAAARANGAEGHWANHPTANGLLRRPQEGFRER